MNEKTLGLLEFGAVLSAVAQCAVSEEAARRIRETLPLGDPLEAAALKSLVSQIADRINSGDEEPRLSLPDIGSLLPKLETPGAGLELDEAYALGLFVDRALGLKNWLLPPEAGGPEESLGALVRRLPDCSEVRREVFRVLDRDGKLRDLPELREIRRCIIALTRDLETLGSRYTGNEETRRMLQSNLPSQRDGRMVLAVKANFRGRIRGIVHEVSSSGQTLFVEPEEVVEKNNQILIEKRRLDTEILRILREMTARIAEYREALGEFHEGILYLETLRARARHAWETRGHFARELKDPEGSLILKQARHPLLGNRAVPIDIEMRPSVRTVIVTGPNTGGKTVALKTLGLFALMNQAGLALPAEEGTCLPVFDGVYADIGDEQSLSQSLSTFSAHMTNIAAITAAVTERSLVLLDELGSGTDPEEGSAIAMAILDYLIAKGVRLIATTHHGILKNYGYSREGVENASVEFDGRTLSPTYRIIMGVPGESRAVDVAARNGLPPSIVAGARGYLAEERADVSALISGLKRKHQELDAAAESRKAESSRLREERRQVDLKELRLRQKELDLKAGGMGSFRLLLSESRKTLENLVRELKEGELSREKTLKVKEFLRDLSETAAAEDELLDAETLRFLEERRRLEELYGEDAPETGSRRKAGSSRRAAAGEREGASRRGEQLSLEPGREVLVSAGPSGGSRRRGIILRAGKKNSWVVGIGSLKMTLSEKDLIPLPPSPEEKKASVAPPDFASPPQARFELSLLGMRLPDALDALDRQIDAAALAGLREFSVVHGKGDGILQKGVHDFLKNQPLVADYYFSRPELGGFGRTEVLLKG
jgi:DNA mismatch repair protein MutS2